MKEISLVETIREALIPKQQSLFAQTTRFEITEQLKKLDSSTLKTLYFYILSEGENVKEDISHFLQRKSQSREPYLDSLSDRVIERIYSVAQKVRREIHRFKGFMRFREVEGKYLYGAFSPDYNIILPLSEHFAKRFREEKIVIHDIKRNIATFCHRGRVFKAVIEREIPKPTPPEQLISELWKRYFDEIGIKERENRKLQRQKVPLKYRRTIIEFGKNLKESYL